jgi:hypothetical protein
MANSDKNILITPATNTGNQPTLVFTGNSAQSITLRALDTGSLAFEGSAGQLLSINNSLTGTLFAINDTSGNPIVEVLDTGEIKLGRLGGQVTVGSQSTTTGRVRNTFASTSAPVNTNGLDGDVWIVYV